MSLSKTRKGPGDTHIFINVELESLIYDLVRHQAFDTHNNATDMNSNPRPPSMTSGNSTGFYYSAGLFKKAMNILASLRGWGVKVAVKTVVKDRSKLGHGDTITTKQVKCLSVPSPNYLASLFGNNKPVLDRCLAHAATLDTFIRSANLVCPTDLNRIYTKDEILRFSAVNTVCKKDRLLFTKGIRGVSIAGAPQWNTFKASEEKRFNYIIAKMTGTLTSSKYTSKLTEDEAKLFNQNILQTAGFEANDNLIKDVMAPLNTANKTTEHQLFNLMDSKKVNTSSLKKEQYASVIEKYRLYTGHTLDLKTEMAQNKLEYWNRMLQMMEQFYSNNPFVMFQHTPNGPMPVRDTLQYQSYAQSSTTQPQITYAPQQKQRRQATGVSSSYNPAQSYIPQGSMYSPQQFSVSTTSYAPQQYGGSSSSNSSGSSTQLLPPIISGGTQPQTQPPQPKSQDEEIDESAFTGEGEKI